MNGDETGIHMYLLDRRGMKPVYIYTCYIDGNETSTYRCNYDGERVMNKQK